jgi:hypothetical protein
MLIDISNQKERDVMKGKLKWARRSNSTNNFDLVVINFQQLDSARLVHLLDRIQEETHRGLSLSGRANREFRRWAEHPDTPLKSDAYVLLSNWFCTNSGDRRSMVASRCEDLWDELFPCRPVRRLSSPEPGKNHAIVPTEFETWWRSLLNAQGDDAADLGVATAPSPLATTRGSDLGNSDADDGLTPEQQSVRPLTLAEAKAALARTFGVSPDKVEITIRG